MSLCGGTYNKHVRSLPGVAHNVLVGQIGDSIAETDQVFSAHADLSDPGILSQLPADVLDARQAQRGSRASRSADASKKLIGTRLPDLKRFRRW